MAAAAAVRDTASGARITWSPKVFIPLTHLCQDKCGYCTFAQPPARVQAPYLSPDEVLAVAQPDRPPERGWPPLEAAGALGTPSPPGTLGGSGESRQARLDALEAIAASHRRHGHVQEVIVQNFLPKGGTAMHAPPPCPED